MVELFYTFIIVHLYIYISIKKQPRSITIYASLNFALLLSIHYTIFCCTSKAPSAASRYIPLVLRNFLARLSWIYLTRASVYIYTRRERDCPHQLTFISRTLSRLNFCFSLVLAYFIKVSAYIRANITNTSNISRSCSRDKPRCGWSAIRERNKSFLADYIGL